MKTATVKKASPVAITGSGQCLDAFLKKLEKKHGTKMRQAVNGTAQEIVQHCVDAYSARFGPGDVGAGGTGKVGVPFKPSPTEKIPLRTTGLLYGKVQSGKTNAAMATVALGLANGFRSFVVLTSDNVLLGDQTLERFRTNLGLHGPRVCGWTDFSKDPEPYGKALKKADIIEDTGVVFVSTKNQAHLASLQKAIEAAGSRGHPTLIIDDEADHASLNTYTSRNARKGSSDASRIFDAIGSLRKAVPNHLYLQITATPQSLLLQSLDVPTKPVFCVLVPPGDGYIGGDIFFSEDAQSLKHRFIVDEAELDDLKGGRLNPGGKTVTPKGLRLALCTFFLGAMQKQLDTDDDEARYTLLVHISQRQQDFRFLKSVVQNFVTDFDQALRGKKGQTRSAEVMRWLGDAHVELKKTCSGLRSLKELADALRPSLTNVTPEIIDADAKSSSVKYRNGMNILIGGNRLGRGLTIDGLMVTYYGRDPRTPLGDTVHQHARMFGYRQSLLDVTRIFSAEHLLDGFRAIHESDEGTRKAIGDDPGNLLVKPVWVGAGIRPTRSNVLNPADVGAITPGATIYPPDPLWRKVDTDTHFNALDVLLKGYAGDDVYHQVPIGLLPEILKHMPSHRIPTYQWEDRRVVEVLAAIEAQCGVKTARLNMRRGKGGTGLELTRQQPPWDGFVSSGWASTAKKSFPDEPTLIVMMQKGAKGSGKGGGWEGRRVYVPTLVLPSSGFVFMFNYA